MANGCLSMLGEERRELWVDRKPAAWHRLTLIGSKVAANYF